MITFQVLIQISTFKHQVKKSSVFKSQKCSNILHYKEKNMLIRESEKQIFKKLNKTDS